MILKNFVSVFILISFSLTTFFIPVSTASAQSINTLGEIKTTGSVYIRSSVGQWMTVEKTYPLLQNSAIKTAIGSASLFFKDGARVDISNNSAAVISGSSSDHKIHLSQGIIAFNINASSSLSVVTPSTTVFINKGGDLIHKVGLKKQQRTLGAISVTEKGTEIRSISGKILASLSASESKAITSGESLLIANDGKYKIYKTQAFPSGGNNKTEKYSDAEIIQAWIMGGVFIATVTAGAFGAFGGGLGGVSSPSFP